MNPGPRREIFKYFVLSPELSELNGHLLHEGWVTEKKQRHNCAKGYTMNVCRAKFTEL